MSGKAMLTIVASTNAMKTPSEETASTVVGDGARRRARRSPPVARRGYRGAPLSVGSAACAGMRAVSNPGRRARSSR